MSKRVMIAAKRAGVPFYPDTAAQKESRLGLERYEEIELRRKRASALARELKAVLALKRHVEQSERSQQLANKFNVLDSELKLRDVLETKSVFSTQTLGFARRVHKLVRTLYRNLDVQRQADNPRKVRTIQKALIPLLDQLARLMGRDITRFERGAR